MVANTLAGFNAKREQVINLKVILSYVPENLSEMIAINAVGDSQGK